MIFHFETQYTEGILWGLSAAFMASFFTILNEKVVKTTKAGIISFYEMIGGFALMTLVILLFTDKTSTLDFNLSKEDYIYLILLSTVCTAFAYVLGVRVMEKLSAYTVVLTTNLEPIYGIILAFIFFGETEKMTPGFYLGGLIILLGVFLYPLLNKKRAKRLLSRKMH
jgi:drug/metabolite transporter (DMT)-like permease